MRVKLVFHYDGKYPLPFNRKYAISSWIYRCIRSFNEEYSEKLHFDRDIKLFVFSDLFIPRYRVVRGGLYTKANEVSLTLSSPRSEFISNLVKGLLNSVEKNPLTLRDVPLTVKSIETLRTPEFTDTAEFKALSPIVTSTYRDERIYYLPPHKDQFYENIAENLRKKHLMVHGKQYKKDIIIDLIWTKCPKHPQTSIRIKKGHVVGFKVPLTLTATPTLLKTAYECGLGEKNSMGFGMVDLYR
jgi:CRISPR-associated endoribonuclease Cas6